NPQNGSRTRRRLATTELQRTNAVASAGSGDRFRLRGLKVPRGQAGVLGDPGEHARADFVIVVEGKDVTRPGGPFQDAVRPARLPLDTPPDPQKCRQDAPGFRRRPPTHGITAKTLLICGTGSPWSSRSARTRKDRACTRSIASWRD